MPTDTAVTLEDVLNVALDTDAGDLVARSALADLYEEQGRFEKAEGQRWLIAQGKWPTFQHGCYHDDFPWDWWPEVEEGGGPAHAALPLEFYDLKVPPYRRTNGLCQRYPTRIEAEQTYIDWARHVGALRVD